MKKTLHLLRSSCKRAALAVFLWSSTQMHAISVGADVSAFFPSNSNLRAIYGNAWANYALRVDQMYPFPNHVPQLSVFGQINYLFKTGNSTGCFQPTQIWIVPATLGLKWRQPLHEKVEVYLGAGPRYYFMHIKNFCFSVPQKQTENGLGFFSTIGASIFATEQFVIDIFCNYSYMRFSAPPPPPNAVSYSTDISGFDLGGGFSWKF